MTTNKKKITQRKTQKKRESSIEKLTSFFYGLKTNLAGQCKLGKNCIIPQSQSGQKILICKDSVFKSPPGQNNLNRIEEAGPDAIKLDIFNMNLLIQSVINVLPKSLHKDVEHYDKICKYDNHYILQSKKFGFKVGKKTYNSLEGYLQNVPKIDVDLVCKWLEQICKTLDILYDKIQFHHCDTKAAQIFLDKSGFAILGDLDKVTFTLVIDKPYRIRLTHFPYTNILQNIISEGSIPENLHLLSKVEVMRFENNPRTSPDLEKAAFIGSVALLSQNQENANKIIEKTKSLYKSYKIVLPEDITKAMRPRSHKASVRYIQRTQPPKYASKLKSVVKLVADRQGKLRLTT
jgi:hypothetical protein